MDVSESITDRQRRFYSRLRLMTERSESADEINDASFQRRDGRVYGKPSERYKKRPRAGHVSRIRRPDGSHVPEVLSPYRVEKRYESHSCTAQTRQRRRVGKAASGEIVGVAWSTERRHANVHKKAAPRKTTVPMGRQDVYFGRRPTKKVP
ncbi:hypothetical protein NP493_545g01053 [Ridgeia piscesae]|uniref:Uncharacterized protein n=1 Tax=Ridgeia piscesae TaxID=27915 RepID=A0AAD9KVF9_RIDPI|nr:hypothetical protein NP493_545g01053 [Ridgeia piscesae]